MRKDCKGDSAKLMTATMIDKNADRIQGSDEIFEYFLSLPTYL